MVRDDPFRVIAAQFREHAELIRLLLKAGAFERCRDPFSQAGLTVRTGIQDMIWSRKPQVFKEGLTHIEAITPAGMDDAAVSGIKNPGCFENRCDLHDEHVHERDLRSITGGMHFIREGNIEILSGGSESCTEDQRFIECIDLSGR